MSLVSSARHFKNTSLKWMSLNLIYSGHFTVPLHHIVASSICRASLAPSGRISDDILRQA